MSKDLRQRLWNLRRAAMLVYPVVGVTANCGGVQSPRRPIETIVVDPARRQTATTDASQSGEDAVAPRVRSKSEREKVELTVGGFLQYLKRQAPPASDRFQVQNAGKIDIEKLLKYFPETGIVFADANSEEAPKHFSLEDLRKESKEGKIEQGTATFQLLHLGYIAAHPYPQYSRLQYQELGNSVWLVSVANWYTIRLKAKNDCAVIERVEYVMGEDL